MKKNHIAAIAAVCLASVLVFCGCSSAPKSGATETAEFPSEAAAVSSYTFPTYMGQTCLNPVPGVQCVIPDSWMYVSEEELAKENGLSEMPEDMSAACTELLDAGSLVTVLLAQNPENYNNLSVIVSKDEDLLLAVQKQGIDGVTAGLAEDVKASLEEHGGTDIQVRIANVDFPADEYGCVASSGIIDGEYVFQKQVYIADGDYFYLVSATTFGGDYTDNVIGYFSEY